VPWSLHTYPIYGREMWWDGTLRVRFWNLYFKAIAKNDPKLDKMENVIYLWKFVYFAITPNNNIINHNIWNLETLLSQVSNILYIHLNFFNNFQVI